METRKRMLFSLIGSLLFFVGMSYMPITTANTPNNQSNFTNTQAGNQVAYYRGYHGYRGGYGHRGYRGYGYRRGVYYAAPVAVYGAARGGAYWTGWKYVGHGCSRSCLVNRGTGHIVRCKQRCR